jgi:acetylornithine deacetylase/succinyl-diaminopimelate desuccinylase family protein
MPGLRSTTVDDLARLLSDLVAIPSVNPMGRGLSGPEFLESRLTAYLEEWLGSRGVRLERQPIAPDRDNLLAWFDPPDARRRVLFDVHQDTVPVGGMTIPPFVPTIERGRLHGRGSCDVKGSMTAMLVAFARLVRERPRGAASVLLACTVDEEFTHQGSSRLSMTNHGAALAIVAEPTLLDIVHCHKGVLRWKVRTEGVACHSSTPELGQNAIYRMAKVVEGLERYAAILRHKSPHEILGTPTLSVGRIEGGESVNVVPDWCEVEVDRRLIPGEDPDESLSAARTWLTKELPSEVRFAFSEPGVRMPPLASSVSDWLEPLSGAIERATGRRPALRGVPFGTDAGPLSATGVPCVVFGPGDIAQAHTKDEWIDLDQVAQAAEAYFQIVLELGGRT